MDFQSPTLLVTCGRETGILYKEKMEKGEFLDILLFGTPRPGVGDVQTRGHIRPKKSFGQALPRHWG